MLQLRSLLDSPESPPVGSVYGRIISVQGPIARAQIPLAALGDLCEIERRDGSFISAQIVGFKEDTVTLAPIDSLAGVSPGAQVRNLQHPLSVTITDALIGQVLDARGQPTGLSPSRSCTLRGIEVPVEAPPPSPLNRTTITTVLKTGVAALDGFCTIGYGQRVGLFAGAGTGKSTLLGMIAKNADVDLAVIALVGERGREVREFIEDALGPEGLKKSILVVSTSDEPSLRRAMAASTATAIAEHYRKRGKRVLLLVDSLTRYARALREVHLAAGELPVRQGYTPSVYTQLPALLERAGTDRVGSITAIYTVLTEGEVEIDPLGEEVKSILDGHIILTNSIARQGIRPAIDLTESVSRLIGRLHDSEYRADVASCIQMCARLKRDKDILLLGGTPDKELRTALDLEPKLRALLNQHSHTSRDYESTRREVREIAQLYTRGLK